MPDLEQRVERLEQQVGPGGIYLNEQMENLQERIRVLEQQVATLLKE